MTPAQYYALGLLALVGLSMIATFTLLAASYVRFNRERKARDNLLKRLEDSATLKTSARPKYHKNWSQM